MMNRGRVIQGRVEYRVDYQVEYQILGEFLSIKVEFLANASPFSGDFRMSKMFR